MQILISHAYGADSDRVQGPAWIGSQQYDVTAKSEGERKLSYDELKPLLQDLLAQRFQLKVHTQMKEGSGYALVVAKGGATLQETKGARRTTHTPCRITSMCRTARWPPLRARLAAPRDDPWWMRRG